MSFFEMTKVPRHVVLDVSQASAWCAHLNAGREGYDEIYFDTNPGVKWGDTIGLRHNGHVWAVIKAHEIWSPGEHNNAGEQPYLKGWTVEIDCEETVAHYLTHRGYYYDRTKYTGGPLMPSYVNVERIFAEHWERQNQRNPGLNYGHGILQDLMLSCEKYKKLPPGESAIISPREAAIVAEVVQWFGSNCGREFLRQVLREAKLTTDTL